MAGRNDEQGGWPTFFAAVVLLFCFVHLLGREEGRIRVSAATARFDVWPMSWKQGCWFRGMGYGCLASQPSCETVRGEQLMDQFTSRVRVHDEKAS